MESRHFHFLRNSGLYHHLIEDLPHGLVGLAQLVMIHTCEKNAWLSGVTGVDEQKITLMSTIISIGSIVFGLVNKAIQLLVLRAGGGSGAGMAEALLPGSTVLASFRQSELESLAARELARRGAVNSSTSGVLDGAAVGSFGGAE